MNRIGEDARRAWREAADPGRLFMTWWALASEWSPADRAVLLRPTAAIRNRIAAAAALDDGRSAVDGMLDVLGSEWPTGDGAPERRHGAGLVLEAMRVVDEAFEALHPRSRTLAPIFGPSTRLPGWLDGMGKRRILSGDFSEQEGRRLIPNGPFSRHARGREASSADSLQDRFPILTVAPTHGRHEDRTVSIAIKVIGTDTMRGVPASKSIGRERIRFIPLAEEASDLNISPGTRGSQLTLDVRPAVDTAARLLEGLRDGGDVDIAFAPELTVSGGSGGDIASGIGALAKHAPRIILAGSGLTAEVDDLGRSWNEASVFARGGYVLWRQRKIWPFGMRQPSAIEYGFADPGADGTLMEDIAGHSTLTVVDMDGFGRCIVLICQDFECRTVIDEIVARYQPDWVLTPVLDPGVNIPGWAHQRALSLSKLAQARYLVGSSLSLSRLRKDASDPPVGLAVGPAEPTKAPPGPSLPKRAVALVKAVAGPSPRFGVLVWDHAKPDWKTSSVGSD